MLIGSAQRWALMHELRGAEEPDLPALLTRLSPVDLVLVEGFKRGPHPKIEVHRIANGKVLMFPGDVSIIALATDLARPVSPSRAGLDQVGLDDIAGIVQLVHRHALAL